MPLTGSEESIINTITLPISRETSPLKGLSTKKMEEEGLDIKFSLSDGKSSGIFSIEPLPANTVEFRPKNERSLPLVSFRATLETKKPYKVFIKRPNGEKYSSLGTKGEGDKYDYSNWRKVEDTDAEEKKVPPFTALEIQALGITFEPAQKIIERGWH